MFSVTNFPYRKSEVEEKFEELSSKSLNGKKISLCRINEASPEWNNVQQDKTVCLYIGKAEHIHETIKKHLFLYSAKTHALHLEKWLDPKLTITIDIWGFHAPLHGKNPGYLQTIEDFLWKRYIPLFGRQKKSS